MRLKLKQQINLINSNLDDISNEIAKQNKLKDIELQQKEKQFNWEKETKDRVNISLKDYEQLKADLDKYKQKSLHYQQIFDSLKLGCYLDFIDPHSIVIATTKDTMRLQTRVHIQFDCNEMFEFQHETPSRLYQQP